MPDEVRFLQAEAGTVGSCRLDNLPRPAYETAHAYPLP